jgi:hypothetical protein
MDSGNNLSLVGANSVTTTVAAGNSGTLALAAGASGAITFSINSEDMRILANGNVGIGTTSPSAPLHIVENAGAAIGLKIQNLNSTDYTQMSFIGTGETYQLGVGNAAESGLGIANKFYLYDASQGAVRLTVNSTGNVGIGSTSPQATLDVNGYARMTLQSSQPVACSGTNQGAIALNHLAQMCACNGTSWILVSLWLVVFET